MKDIDLRLLNKLFSNSLVEKRRAKQFDRLSNLIEERLFKSLGPIKESNSPKEMRPLIKQINRLITHFENRSLHERDFSANASHELRTPLAGIRLQTEIAMSAESNTIRKKAHNHILTAIDKSERLIDQLLILARLTADRVILTMTKVNLGELSVIAVSNVLSTAEAKNINIKIAPSEKSYTLASEESILILLHNILYNAIKYSPQGSEILIKTKSTTHKCTVSIVDQGPGIAKENYDLVVNRFQKEGSNPQSGSGLGLAIVKRVCDLHHATLHFDKPKHRNGLKVSIIFDSIDSRQQNEGKT